MDPIIIGLLGLGLLFVILIIGLPVGLGMMLIGFAGFAYIISPSATFTKVANSSFLNISDYSLSVLPLFILMAEVIFAAGLGKDLYRLAEKWLGHLPGGLGMATIGACAIFASISSSSVATAVTMGSVALPEMKTHKYDPRLAAGTVAAGGTLGILIPPSGVLIMYGVITQESIGALFIAGIIPGIILTIAFLLSIYIRGRMNSSLCPRGPESTIREKLFAFGSCGEIIVLVVFVLTGLMIGWFTPTEAGAVGAFGAIAISLIRKRLSWQSFKEALRRSATTIGMIYVIIIGAFILNYFVTVSGIPYQLAGLVEGLPLPPSVTMGIIILIYLVLGCLLDAGAMILLTIPIFFPLVLSLGFDPIWFGIIVVVVAEMAMITPPIGMNVFAISGMTKDTSMFGIFQGVIPFVFVMIIFVILLLIFPQIALFLPNLAA